MSQEYVCLSTLRGISGKVAAILDRYLLEKAIWVPVNEFEKFAHTLYYGNFADLDLHLLDGLDPDDHAAMLAELRAYNKYLHCQRERVSRFHQAYHRWLGEREKALPVQYQEQLRIWHQRYGTYDYLRITGLATKSGFQRFVADPEGWMGCFEQAFADLAEQREHEREWQAEAEAHWWSDQKSIYEQERVTTQLVEALHQLGLSPGATLTQIRHAYRSRAKALHPDRQGGGSTTQMVALNQAYNLLCRFYRSTTSEARRSGS
ncbi:MAG: J domain-containing protein [Ktedonobacteraceae bacterium]